jgi:hypothetical protein
MDESTSNGKSTRSASVKQIEYLAKQLNNALLGQDSEPTRAIIAHINTRLDEMAAQVSGVRADTLANEGMDDSPIVRLFWTTRAELTAKMLMSAAQQQSYYKELDK